MTNTIKLIGAGIAGGLVVLLLSVVLTGGSSDNLQGVYSEVVKDFSQGISVDGTVVIDGDGNVDAPVTSTTGTFSSTLSVTGNTTFSGALSTGKATTSTTTIAIGKVCYSLTSFDGTDLYGYYNANGTFATSTTSCN